MTEKLLYNIDVIYIGTCSEKMRKYMYIDNFPGEGDLLGMFAVFQVELILPLSVDGMIIDMIVNQFFHVWPLLGRGLYH